MADDPTCVFRCDVGLLGALERALGPPIDSYLNGWQVWIQPLDEIADRLPEEAGTRVDVELEWRLHPPVGFAQPEGLSHHDLWDEVIRQVAAGAERLELGSETRVLEEVWVLLEVYPAFGTLGVEELRSVAEAVVGREATAAGRVDHGRLGGRWKRTKGAFDLPGALLEELGVAD